jgi:hypothetical protein
MIVLLIIDLYIIIYVSLEGSMSDKKFGSKKKVPKNGHPESVYGLLQFLNQFFNFAPVIFKTDQNLFILHEIELRACEDECRYNRSTRHFFKLFLLFRFPLDIDFFILYLIMRKKLLRVLAVCSHWPCE